MPPNRRNTDFLRVVAIFLVVNSHMDALYPPHLAFLATGGMIGNSLFFALSGWGLLLSMQQHKKPFAEWYARRMTRIYPAVWVVVAVLTFPIGVVEGAIRLDNILDALGKFFYPPFWFLQALLIYYALVYAVVARFSYRRLLQVALPVVALYAVCYSSFLDLHKWSIEETPFRLIYYFLVMLWGLYIGSKSYQMHCTIYDLMWLSLSIACIYLHKTLMAHGLLLWFQCVQHVATFPMLYYFAKVASSTQVQSLMGDHLFGQVLRGISTLTLEIFMVNNSIDVFGTKLGPFPINVFALLTLNLGLALLVRVCALPLARCLQPSSAAVPSSSKVFLASTR